MGASSEHNTIKLDKYGNVTNSANYVLLFSSVVFNSPDSRLMQIGGDMEDLESALTGESTLKGPIGSGSCSALIKVRVILRTAPIHLITLVKRDPPFIV